LGITFRFYKVGEPRQFVAQGTNTFVIVPDKMGLRSPDGNLVVRSYLLGISADGGKTWTFVEGESVANEMVRKVLPKLPATLKPPEAVVVQE
jgi:hypothetical protein